MSSSASANKLRQYWNWPLLGIILAWGVLITQVRHHWGGESYYNFGTFVPFLAVWLWVRNMGRGGEEDQRKRRRRVRSPLTLVIAALAILFVLPFHALSEVNPFWRLPLWIQAAGLVTFTGCAIYSLYGREGLKRSAFPIFFLCMMIPWPWRFEQFIIQTLTGYVVTIAMWGLHAIGYPVQLAGNSMVLGDLQIGVNEACSGIRSLQALFMVTLFLGSLFGQGLWRRVAALAILPFIVIFINSLRAMFLAIQVIVNGNEAYEAWHDPIGYIAFGASMVLIYACIELLNIGSERSSEPIGISLPKLEELLSASGRMKERITYALLPVLLFFLVEGWFQFKEARTEESPGWTFELPEEDGINIIYRPIDKMVENALGYDYGQRFVYRKGNSIGEVYFYRYTGEDKLASVSSYGHSPTICMEATGARMLEQFPDLQLKKDPLTLPFHHYLFELPDENRKMHVFWIVWEQRNMDIPPEALQSLNYKTQWMQLMRGRRNFARKIILASIVSDIGEARAKQLMAPLLEQWIQQNQGQDPSQ